ncbi:MAG: hypothetical protein WB661_04975 [Candidatus Bathyarchaeia archaeon]
MGVLVTGATKVEEEVQRFKRNVRMVTEQRRVRAYARLRPTWAHVRNALEDPRVKPIMRRIEPLPNQIEHKTKALLNRAEFRAGIALTDLVDRTIVELEKLKRELDRRFPQRWVAA